MFCIYKYRWGEASVLCQYVYFMERQVYDLCVRVCVCVNYVLTNIVAIFTFVFGNTLLTCYSINMGTAVAQWLRICATNRKVAGSIPVGVIGIFHWHKILQIALWPWSRLSLQQKWVSGAFPGGKGSRCVRLTTLPLSCAVLMKSGNLNFLDPSGPLQACNGTALPYSINIS